MIKNKPLSVVFGAGGFIGSHLVNELVNKGFKVIAVSRSKKIPNHININKDIKWLLWTKAEKTIQKISNIDNNFSVFHLAANLDYQQSIDSPEKFLQINTNITFNLLKILKLANFSGKIIYLSSDRVFGKKRGIIDETELPQPIDYYGLSKYLSEEILKPFSTKSNNELLIIRCVNVYGSFQSSSQLLPSIISQLRLGLKDISVGNLNNSRSYIYIDDLISAFIKLINYKPSSNYEYFHIGTPPIKLDNITKTISSFAAKKFDNKINFIKKENLVRPKKSEIGNFVFNTNKAEKYLGWNVNFNLESGIEQLLINEQIFNAE
tara:strand:- start:1132 stop:2094 length:963 start_codon:yes stop_codon:yes gene_type:complete